MIDKRLLITGAAVLTVIMSVVVVNLLPRTADIVPSRENISDVAIEPESKLESAPGYLYLIKEYNGRIAVFVPGQKEPETILNVMVKYLPDYDREQMREGIAVNSYDELVTLLEDYTS